MPTALPSGNTSPSTYKTKGPCQPAGHALHLVALLSLARNLPTPQFLHRPPLTLVNFPSSQEFFYNTITRRKKERVSKNQKSYQKNLIKKKYI